MIDDDNGETSEAPQVLSPSALKCRSARPAMERYEALRSGCALIQKMFSTTVESINIPQFWFFNQKTRGVGIDMLLPICAKSAH